MRLSVLKVSAAILTLCGLTACQRASEVPETSDTSQSEAIDHSKIVTGNGVSNFIILDGATRSGSTFTFREVAISDPGFLVFHPFKDGKPVQTVFVGSEPVKRGSNANVSITLDREVTAGDMFIVMLHYDKNKDGVFDFGDGMTVPDAPVFEGHTLVALRYSAP